MSERRDEDAHPIMQAIRIHEHGSPDVLRLEPIELGDPGPTELRVRQTAIGLNFIDVYHRTGLYPMQLPGILGREAAGVVEAVGANVKGFVPGDRVAYVLSTSGAYAEARNLPADRAIKLPETISEQEAAAVLLKGLTAHTLLRRACRVKKGDAILVHAAAGGVGLLLVQWARHLGAKVIAATGSPDKVALIREHGAHEVLITDQDLPVQVRRITRKRGVRVVYDSVGKDTFFASLDCLAPLGMMVSFGNASGPVPPVAPLDLGRRGSLSLTRPMLFDYVRSTTALRRAAMELFTVITAGAVKVRVGQTYRLREAAKAHADLEARRTTGSTVLLP